MNQGRKIRVLIVDDSALVREVLARGLSMDPAIEVVGTAADPYIARDRIVQLRPDVLTLDVEMPRMDGVEFLRRLMPQYPLPVLMVSALTQKGKQITLEALEAGAIDFVTKPSTDVARGLGEMIAELRAKVKEVSSANVSAWKHEDHANQPIKNIATRSLAESTDKVIAIGASTGGTEAIREVITSFRPIPRCGDRTAHAGRFHEAVRRSSEYPVPDGGKGSRDRGPGDDRTGAHRAGRFPHAAFPLGGNLSGEMCERRDGVRTPAVGGSVVRVGFESGGRQRDRGHAHGNGA